MGLRDRRADRHEERETFGRGGDARRYQMREKMLSIGDDFWIEDASGERAFRVDGKALRIRNTFHLEDLQGQTLCTIQERKVRVRDSMEIEGPDGDLVALVRKALISPLRDRFHIELGDGPELEAKGNIVDHEYEIEADGRQVATVSKKWFRVRDTYGVEIAPDQDTALLLAVTVAIDDLGDSDE